MSTIASHSPLNISEPLEREVWFQRTTNGESNGHVTDDVTWPRRSNSWPQYA